MSGDLKLSLPERKKPVRPMEWVLLLLVALGLVVGGLNAFLLLGGAPSPTADANANGSEGQDAEALEDLALRFEKQGLATQAAEAWREYLESAPHPASHRASIWYRVGKTHQQAGQYEEAVAAYYRAESLGDATTLLDQIGPRVQECLEAMGRFTALRYELKERTALEGEQQDAEVLAEIGPEKITEADLEHRIEWMVEQQFEGMGAFMDPATRNAQEEEMLKRLREPQSRQRILQQVIAEELLYRKARAEELLEDRAVQAMLRRIERGFVAERMRTRAVAERINITPGDLESHYAANPGKYAEPARVQVAREVFDSEEAAQARIASASENNGLDAPGENTRWLRADQGAPEWGISPETLAALVDSAPGTFHPQAVPAEAGFQVFEVLAKEPARTPPFEEVRGQVYQDLFLRKSRELEQQLIDSLIDEYDVVIHRGDAPQTVGGAGANAQ